MTSNILSAISSFLTPELVGKIASSAGVDRAQAKKAVQAAVPTILTGLADAASRPGGARQLANVLADQPANALSSLAGAIGESAQLPDRGRNLLSALFGGSVLGSIVSALSKYVGTGEGSMRTLVGMLAPAIMGVLGREQQAAGLDAGGLARMLADQKSDIAAAIPAGLSSFLDSSGFYENLGLSGTLERPRVYETSPPIYESQPPPDVTHRAAGNGRSRQRATWPYWVLPLIALAGLVWYLMPGTEVEQTAVEQPVRASPPVTQAKAPPPQQSAAATDKPSYLTKPSDTWISLADYTSKEVHNHAGETIGTVKDLLIGPDGKVAAVVIAVGRTLGLGEKTVAVPFAAILVERRGGTQRIIMDAMKNGLEAAPAFEPRPRT